MIYSVAFVFSAYQDLLCHFADQAFIVASSFALPSRAYSNLRFLSRV